ncbi:ATP-dependent DNA helicase [Campylobacter sp. RM12647]|uniref:ATP-dependent DNA helicase n=1 Tax=Campylobacter sp. RM12647 TaxID=2735737 RepID=UPI001E1A1A9D|nr:AAA family ATPase [Campylobacter sp. RM12647]
MNQTKHIIDLLKQGRNVFLTGGAGVGKSYTIEKIIKSEAFKTIVLASTALAAINIGGDTVHRFFKLRLAKNINELKTSKDDLIALNKSLTNIDLIIIDEISMISSDVFDMIYSRLFGYSNIKLLIVGDFYQLEPVKSDGNYAFCSKYWNECNFKVIELITQHRMEDKEFYENLRSVRIGNITNTCIEYFKKYKIQDDINNYDDYTIICGTNEEAKNINNAKLKKIDDEEYVFNSSIKKNTELNEEQEKEFKQWLKAQPIEEEFIFKIGAKVIFTYNSDNYYNGMQGEIIAWDKSEQELKIKSNRMIYSVYPKEFLYFNDPEIAASYRINPSLIDAKPDAILKAFPLKLSYAITIHKSQGMSIDKLICKCDRIFAQGQLYVALSRSSNPNNFKIIFNGSDKSYENLFRLKAKTNQVVKTFYQFCDKEQL